MGMLLRVNVKAKFATAGMRSTEFLHTCAQNVTVTGFDKTQDKSGLREDSALPYSGAGLRNFAASEIAMT